MEMAKAGQEMDKGSGRNTERVKGNWKRAGSNIRQVKQCTIIIMVDHQPFSNQCASLAVVDSIYFFKAVCTCNNSSCDFNPT